MRNDAYSLLEVLLAAAILALGLSSAAVVTNTLVIQQEQDSGAVRAANLQEQAAMLYRLGFTTAQDIYALLPEAVGSSATPAAGSFSITFGSPQVAVASATLAGGGSADVAYELTSCTVVYGSPASGGGLAYSSSTVNIVRPVIRVGP